MKSVEYFVKGLFRNCEATSETAEQRYELISHLNDKIADLVSSGMSEDEAFNKTVENLGNLDELIETLSGRKVKIRVNRCNLIMHTASIIYGTLYMIIAGFQIAAGDMGLSSLYIPITGWTGYAVPFVIVLLMYIKFPGKTGMVSASNSSSVKSSFAGWLTLSAVCWIVNALIIYTDSSTSPWWAWMPTVGIFTWPLMETVYALAVRRDASKNASVPLY